ncbi:hypothetical protein [Hydrogenivirga sp.]
MSAVEHLWLEAIFDPRKAKELKGRNFQEFIRAASWYRTFRNELSIYGIRNEVLEDFLKSSGRDLKVNREDLKKNLRKYREALYYEANIRKAR